MLHDRQGTVKGFETLNEDYQGKIPLLSYFSVAYEKLGDPAAEIDNEFRSIEVRPDRLQNQLTVGLSDKDPSSTSDRLRYRVVHADVPPSAVANTVRAQRGDLTAVEVVRVLKMTEYQVFPNVWAPILAGFRIGLVDTEDRQLYSLGFMERRIATSASDDRGIYAGLTCHIPFELGLPDRRIDWDVEYALLDNNFLIDVNTNAGPSVRVVTGSATGSTIIPIPELAGPTPCVLIISRFRFAFTNGHHEVRRIAVGQKPGTTDLEVAFHDKNADDPFDYEVSYALLNI